MRLILVTLALLAACPAHAEWLVYPSSDEGVTPIMVCDGPAPTPGVNIPAGSVVKLLERDPADTFGRVERYKLESGKPTYRPKLPRTAPPVDAITAELKDLLENKADKLTDEEYIKLYRISKIQDQAKRDEAFNALEIQKSVMPGL